MAAHFAARPRLCLLVSRAASVLEANTGIDQVRAVKLRLKATALEASQALRAAQPHLSDEAAMRFAMVVFVQIAGLWPMATPPPHVDALLNEPELAPIRMEFEPALREMISVYLRGLAASS